MCSELTASINPRKWRFTWEAQSPISTLRLLLFNPLANCSTQCLELKVNLVIEQSLLAVSLLEEGVEISLRVPIPRVLIDVESPINFRVFSDHIEVKLVLLLPVDHPLVSSFDSILHISEEDSDSKNVASDELLPLTMDSDIMKLSSMEAVNIYCRTCSTKLSKSLRVFDEMPSINWREVADNWFGNCCCSFGGISEKMVTKYAKSYTCTTGTCLLNNTSIILSKDDIEGFNFPKYDFSGDNCLSKSTVDTIDDQNEGTENLDKNNTSCCAHVSEQTPVSVELRENQKNFLNGFLGNVFMAKSSNLSKDVCWVEFLCPYCSCLLGAYPSCNDGAPLDSGVHLFKCYILTSLNVDQSSDLFRKYTLERMFTNQLLESAKDELSFRTVVRELHTKIPILKIVLLNTNSWSYTGYCFGTAEEIDKINIYPTIKVLFADCSKNNESELRIIEEWVTKNEADEVYMLESQIKELMESLESANKMLPLSHSILQGLPLSSLRK